MNLSLYLLLTPPIDSEASVRSHWPPELNTRRYSSAVLDLVPPRSARGFALNQASRCSSAPKAGHRVNVVKLEFAARVVFNAMGFLLMTSGLLMLLQVGQVSLS